MIEYIEITILVPEKDIEIEARPAYCAETRHEPASWDANVECVSVKGLGYEVDQDGYNDDIIDKLAVKRFEELDND